MQIVNRPVIERYGVALLAVILVAIIRLPLNPLIGITAVPFILYFPAVMISGWYGRFGPGVLATITGAFAALYFNVEPVHHFSIPDANSSFQLVLFVVIGIFISALNEAWHRSNEALARAQEAERSQREWFHVTLKSVGDAVLATDEKGIINFINMVAQSLTGWEEKEACGKRLDEIFVIINEQTREKVESPVDKVLQHGGTVGLANHTVLIARDGSEVPIDDSGAPIKDLKGKTIGVVLVFHDISERRNLEQSRNQLAAIVESSEDAIIGKDLDGNITSWNRGAERLYGYKAEEVIGKSVALLIPADKPEDLSQIMEKIKRDESISHYETQRITKDGKLLDISLTVSPIYNSAAHVIGASTVARDITERKQADKNQNFLFEVAEIIRRTENPDDLLFTISQVVGEHLQVRRCLFNEIDLERDRETVHRDYCNGVESVAGVHKISDYSTITSAEIAGGKTVVNRDSQLDPRTADYYEKIYALNGERAYVAVPLLRENRWVASLWVSDDRPRNWSKQEVGVLESIAERTWFAVEKLRNEQALRESEERLRRATEIETVGIIFFKTDSSIIETNDAFLQMSGYSREELQAGQLRWDHMTPPEWLPRSRQAAAEFAASGRTTPYEKEYYRKDGSRWWALTAATRLKADEGVEYILDISARKHAEQEREALLRREQAARLEAEEARRLSAELLKREEIARAQAEQANRTKDEFLATVSHELRTPLNAILGWSRMLRSGALDATTTERAVETVERNARAQAEIIEDLLDVSRIITGKLRLEVQAVELPVIIQEALEAVRPAADAKEIRLQSVLDPNAGPISGDPNRLQQIIWNLLSNAVKFTHKGGRVQIRLERINSNIEITVSDTGEGISADFLPFVFDRFRQQDGSTTRKHGGLGLGLAIVRHLVELHGGTVEAQSDGEGHGATFKVVLPLFVSHQAVHRRDAAPRQVGGVSNQDIPDTLPRLEGLRILIVEDEPDSLDLLITVLQRCGAEVQGVTTAAAAFAALRQNPPDILVSDIEMPGEDGYSLINKIRSLPARELNQILAVALTGYAKAEDRLRSLASGFDAHVAKPLEPLELITVIISLLRRAGKRSV